MNPTNPMTPLSLDAIAHLRAGPEIDRFVHSLVMDLPEEPNRTDIPCYSETTGALTLLSAVPIEVGRFKDTDPEFNESRPFFGRFTVGPVQDPKSYMFKCATAELALCKAALAYITVAGKPR
jgi:hypothetical protein